MPRKPKAVPIDGFGVRERERIASVVKQVWYQIEAAPYLYQTVFGC